MSTVACQNVVGLPKKRYPSARAARRDLARRRTWRDRRWPATYKCPGCKGVHLTHGGQA